MSLRESHEKPKILICMKCKNMSRHIPAPTGNICEVCGSALIPLELYKKTTQYQIDELEAALSQLWQDIKDEVKLLKQKTERLRKIYSKRV